MFGLFSNKVTKIEEKLSVFVDQINKILPRDQHIFFSYPKNNCENNLISFSHFPY